MPFKRGRTQQCLYSRRKKMEVTIIIKKSEIDSKTELKSKIIGWSDHTKDHNDSIHFITSKEKILECLSLLLESNVPHKIDFSPASKLRKRFSPLA
jgi:hypothetical protein